MGFIYGMKSTYLRNLPKTNFPTPWLGAKSAFCNLIVPVAIGSVPSAPPSLQAAFAPLPACRQQRYAAP